jgi:hypothetical protein
MLRHFGSGPIIKIMRRTSIVHNDQRRDPHGASVTPYPREEPPTGSMLRHFGSGPIIKIMRRLSIAHKEAKGFLYHRITGRLVVFYVLITRPHPSPPYLSISIDPSAA